MTPSNTIEELVGRVEAATGPEREIDGLLHAQLVMGWDYAHFVASEGYWFRQNEISRSPNHVSYAFGGDRVPDDEVPAYTASIDAALALAERVLPGYQWGVSMAPVKTGETTPEGYPRFRDGFKAHVTKRSALRPMPTVASAPTAPLAIILATLRSLRIKGDHNDEA